MNAALISALMVAFAAGAASTPQADAVAESARAALLAPAGHEVTLTCAARIFATFGVKVAERNGELLAKFPRCEKPLQQVQAGVFTGEYCNSQPFQWVYQPGDAATAFKGTAGRSCSVQLAHR